ncbi:g2461 [Coccomyxa viridis]|uniref:G2461 protein n=1 Tax=Coccomyxa viridis TaxID=1274662 RepID=A0ABP1FP60_9CHLO
MGERDDDQGLRSSWKDVHKMHVKADAAQEQCKQEQEVSEADAPKKEQSGAQEVERHAKGHTAAGEDTEWVLEDPAISEQECFEGEAEVIQGPQKDATLHFEEEDTCVQPSKPDFDDEAGLDFDSASEGDPEAASLAGSDHEYAFVLDPPNKKLPEMEKEAPPSPDKEHASSALQCPAKLSRLAAKPIRTGYGNPQSASSQIWQQATSTEPKTALSRSTMY